MASHITGYSGTKPPTKLQAYGLIIRYTLLISDVKRKNFLADCHLNLYSYPAVGPISDRSFHPLLNIHPLSVTYRLNCRDFC